MLGNFGSNNDHFVGVGPWNGDMTLGDWGVNTSNHTVWAVVNHNSEFASGAIANSRTFRPALLEPVLSPLSATVGDGEAWREIQRRHRVLTDRTTMMSRYWLSPRKPPVKRR